MEKNNYTVYVKADSCGYITAVNSSAFLTDTKGWTEIDSGPGDKYHHAQGNYFPQHIRTLRGAYRYKLADGAVVECTEEEIAEQEAASQPAPTLEDRVGTLEDDTADLAEALNMILEGATE